MSADYGEQQRGSGEAYARYLASMDASMRQKVALTAAHFLCRGRVADMGMGSGSGTHAIAALYPALEVIGVDVDERMVALARERHRLPNLRFVQGDVAAPVFEDGSLDGILDSSVLHHVTSFGGYRHDAAREAIATQVRALRSHGVLVIRDFIAPEDGEAPVLLDLPFDDGDGSDDPLACSSAALLVRFAREFRSLSAAPGFPLDEEPPPRQRWRRFRLAHRYAVEFVLRKDYRADWAQEVKEEYAWTTQRGCERLFGALGLRLLASTPIRNPWIVANRWEGKVELRDAAGRPLELPPTNYLIAGERVGPGDGVRFRARRSGSAPRFLELTHVAHRATRKIKDLVRRPHLTVDVVPHFDLGGDYRCSRHRRRRARPTSTPVCASREPATRSSDVAPPDREPPPVSDASWGEQRRALPSPLSPVYLDRRLRRARARSSPCSRGSAVHARPSRRRETPTALGG